MSKKFTTSIGGQALIEGVMMRGPIDSAMSVRNTQGEIITEEWKTSTGQWYRKVPLVRGSINLITSLFVGYKTLMRSAELSGIEDMEEEPTKFEKWIADKFGANIMTVIAVIAIIMGTALATLLFVVIPTTLGSVTTRFTDSMFVRTLVEGILKMIIFIGYVFAVSKMPDIKRVFQYHGAEHKTIFCYENGLDLTVENVKPMSRLHPRCGTSFMLFVMVISILIFSLVHVENTILRMVLKVLLLPVVAGVSYEVLMFAGKHDNAFTRVLSTPGMWMQKLTTAEPDDQQIEVAITAMKAVIPEEQGLDVIL